MDRTPAITLTRKDFRIEYFSGSGAGGQARNKKMTACRVTHPASGAQSECQEHRSAKQNFADAFRRLAEKPRFKYWVQQALIDQDGVEKAVERAMQPENVLVEVRVENRWVPMPEAPRG